MQEGGKRKIPFVAVWFFLGLSPALMLNTRHQIFINPTQTGGEWCGLSCVCTQNYRGLGSTAFRNDPGRLDHYWFMANCD